MSSRLLPLAVLLAILAAWQVVAGHTAAYALPPPAAVLAAFASELRDGHLKVNLAASLGRVALGYGLAVLLGVPLGLVVGHVASLRTALSPVIDFFRCLSPLAWIPFAILWFGIGNAPAVFLIFMAVFFPLITATAAAVANIPRVYFRVARDHGLAGPALLARVTLPAALPQIVTALRVGAGLAWMVVVAAEMVAGRDGLGFAIWDARNGLRTDLLVSGMVVIGAVGVALDLGLKQLMRLPQLRWAYDG